MENDYVNSLTAETLLEDEPYLRILEEKDPIERQKLTEQIGQRARELKCWTAYRNMLKTWRQKYIDLQKGQKSNHLEFTDSPLPGLACGQWTATNLGVSRQILTTDLNTRMAVACPHPIQPVERLRNLNTETEKLKLAFYKDCRWQTVTAERSVCANKSRIIDLADRGVEVTSETAKDLVQYIADVVSLNTAAIPVCDAVSHCGWIGGEFAPYCDGIRYDGDSSFQRVYDSIRESGDYASWVDYCRKLRKNKYLRLQMASSFASPLLEKLGVLPFALHLWGGTGTGKTVGLMVAMSIWGNPELGELTKTMNMTANSLAEYAAFLNSIPFGGDELQVIKSRWDNNYDNLIMYLTEGINRSRLRGSGKLEQQKTWRCSFLFTGEEPITKGSSGGGVKNRVIEIGLRGNDCVVENGNETANFVRTHYGFAGKAFVSYVRDKELQKPYQALFDQIIEDCDTTEKQAMAMACILLADKLATECIFPGETPLTVADVRPFLTSVKEVDIAQRAYDWAINWVAQNHARFVKSGNNGETWGKVSDEIALINKNVFAEHLQRNGFDYTAVIGKFAERGQIKRNSQGKFVHQTKAFGIKANYIKLVLPEQADEEVEILDLFEDSA